MNPLSPERMTPAERLDEIAAILAAGFVRLKAKQSSRLFEPAEKSFVDFAARQSRHDAAKGRAEK